MEDDIIFWEPEVIAYKEPHDILVMAGRVERKLTGDAGMLAPQEVERLAGYLEALRSIGPRTFR